MQIGIIVANQSKSMNFPLPTETGIDPYEQLFSRLTTTTTELIPDEEKALMRARLKQRLYPKRRYLLQEGEINKDMAFIVSGAARIFSIDEKGLEHTVDLHIESDWVLDIESYHLQTPSRFFIEILEKTTLLILAKSDFARLHKSAPAVWEALRATECRRQIASQNRLHASISLSAAERYAEFRKSSPAFIGRFPQSMIASFLGITAETLSRIRRHR